MSPRVQRFLLMVGALVASSIAVVVIASAPPVVGFIALIALILTMLWGCSEVN